MATIFNSFIHSDDDDCQLNGKKHNVNPLIPVQLRNRQQDTSRLKFKGKTVQRFNNALGLRINHETLTFIYNENLTDNATWWVARCHTPKAVVTNNNTKTSTDKKANPKYKSEIQEIENDDREVELSNAP